MDCPPSEILNTPLGRLLEGEKKYNFEATFTFITNVTTSQPDNHRAMA